MKLLKSEKGIPIPKIFFISDRSEIKSIPKGVPFIYGGAAEESYIVRILEYEVLYQRAIKTGYPFNFKKILKDNGFLDIEDFGSSSLGCVAKFDFSEGGSPGSSVKFEELEGFGGSGSDTFKTFIRDSSVYVDVSVLKNLNIFPIWLDNIEEAVSTNINNFAVYDNNMYNKKLEGMYGGVKLQNPNKNLIIIDISGSIPKAVSSTCLALAKNLSENFYADLLITGSKSTLYPYEQIGSLDIDRLYDENGTDNDQTYFKKLLSETERDYNSAIVFGDSHSPCHPWSNIFNSRNSRISIEEGKALNKWKVKKVLSFHTGRIDIVAGYADWFTPDNIESIGDWVKDLNDYR